MGTVVSTTVYNLNSYLLVLILIKWVKLYNYNLSIGIYLLFIYLYNYYLSEAVSEISFSWINKIFLYWDREKYSKDDHDMYMM